MNVKTEGAPIVPRARMGLAAKQATGAGPQGDRRTKRKRTRATRKAEALRDWR